MLFNLYRCFHFIFQAAVIYSVIFIGYTVIVVKSLMNSLLFQIICNRASVFNKEIFKKIKNLLEEQFYVPVLRSDDNSLQPVVGEPFCPPQLPVCIVAYGTIWLALMHYFYASNIILIMTKYIKYKLLLCGKIMVFKCFL